MNISIHNPEEINKIGIYKITNIINNKFYIGSTTESFAKRWKNHITSLRRNTHKNEYLQNAFNKYGENSFMFSILELCNKNDCLSREQIYLNEVLGINCYNINPNATALCNTKETIDKQIKSRKLFYKECLEWYDKVKNKQIKIDEIPDKFKIRIKSYLDNVPWNKGKQYHSTEHLKVPHKKSDRSTVKNTMRNKQLPVFVYDLDLNYLDCFRSAKDLEELSTTLIFPIKSRFRGDRMGVPVSFLNSGNINKAIKTKKPYKGLYFYNRPLHPGMDDVNKPKSVEVWNDNTEVSMKH